MPSNQTFPAVNRLLEALPKQDRQHLLSGCVNVQLPFGTILGVPGGVIRHVYFPTSCFISLVNPVEGNGQLEVALVGSEGMYGVPLVLGVNVSAFQAMVQGGGSAWRMDTERFISEFGHGAALQQRLNRYVCVRMSQLAQTAACIRFHLVEERLARWLLTTGDRAHSAKFHITHELLAKILGVRRVGVTRAAGSLHRKKLISYSRGDVTINDIDGLEAASCKCYQTDKEIYDRILGC